MSKPSALLVATVKNEGPHILEWVAHHRLCGFDRIQVYQNDSSDTTARSLRVLARIGAIEYFDNTGRAPNGAYQIKAYGRASQSQAYQDCDWCMVLDGDEFLTVKTGNQTVQDLIAACPDDTDAILVNWKVFGSGGHRRFSEALVTERYTQAEAHDDILTHMAAYKPLFRTTSYKRAGIHLPKFELKDDCKICNASGLPDGTFKRINWRGLDPEQRKYAQVNHYILRDLSSFLLKRARGSANAPHRDIGLRYWTVHNRNAEEDRSLADRAPALRAEIERLDALSDGRLGQLRDRALRQWRKTLRAASDDEELQALKADILALENAPEEA